MEDTDMLAQGYAKMKAYRNTWLMANKAKLKQRLYETFRQTPTETGTEY
jgi:hypothetical protein